MRTSLAIALLVAAAIKDLGIDLSAKEKVRQAGELGGQGSQGGVKQRENRSARPHQILER